MGFEKNESSEPIISDGNYDYFNRQPTDYKTIVLKCIQDILFTNSKLLTSSGKVYLKIEGQIIQQEENTLKIYYQQIDLLEDLMTFFFDEQAKNDIKKAEEGKSSIIRKYYDIYLSRQLNENKRYRIQAEQTIPKDDSLGQWCWEQIEEETKQCYRQKLRALLLLFKRKNDLSGKRIASYL